MKQSPIFVIDFDSTFTTVEALDELAKIALRKHPGKQRLTEEIQSITTLGMEGKLGFAQSLTKRLSLFQANQDHIKKLIALLKKKITPSIAANKQFFKEQADNIYIISGGFKDYIYPVVKAFGIKEDHILANQFLFNKRGEVVSVDEKSPLSMDEGKVKAVKLLKLPGTIIVIGDGMTDYHIRQKGLAQKFVVFTENIRRQPVVDVADEEIKSFDELLFQLRLPRSQSYPKSMMKVLLLENIDTAAVDMFAREGYSVEKLTKALSEDELIEKIKDVSILGIRSKTEVTERVIQHSSKLLAIGAFCIGTNQINLSASAKNGIAVFNAPYSNTRSVVELALGEIIMLYRQTIDKSNKLHQGVWDKSAKGSHEIRGKKLGIVGYGNIGSQLSVIAEALGMEVYFYDIVDKLALGNAKKCSTLEELLRQVDIVTIHVDGRKPNTNLIDEKQFSQMKDGVLFLNLSRGFVVNVSALAKYIKINKVAGAAIDVFPQEPKSNTDPFKSVLQDLPNTILTPHVAGSTTEAQKNIAEFVSQKLLQFVDTGDTMLSVNFPHIQLPEFTDAHRFIHTHKNQPGILAQINNIFAKNKINIDGQYLKTNEEIGYVITDVNKNSSKKVLDELKSISHTIRVRVLY